ncbi:anoctamin-7-like [Mobula hypostoma]|uniref:anoctamin-7-like n=1 Tax=Mobula hypostoma TaxID=723540 RepID=UPI002FC3D64D
MTKKMKMIPIIDYVLVYEWEPGSIDPYAELRLKFLRDVENTGLRVDHNFAGQKWAAELTAGPPDKYQIVKIYAPFELLSRTAERMKLKMPLAEFDAMNTGKSTRARKKNVGNHEEVIELKVAGCFQKFMSHFKTETVVNYISAHYEHEKRHLFKGIENEETFFRPALRSLIVHYILTNIPIETGHENVEANKQKFSTNIPALPYLLLKKAFKSSFVLHDIIKGQLDSDSSQRSPSQNTGQTKEAEPPEARTELNNLWANTYLKFQPLWKIRNYFGEKIALYFAVMETLLVTLIIPAFLGLATFIYGLYFSINCYNASSKLDESLRNYNYKEICSSPDLISGIVENSVKILREACGNVGGRRKIIETGLNRTCASKTWDNATFYVHSGDFFTVIQSALDNDATPWFGLIVCLWGTIFLELWKRVNAKLVYEWDVENFENDEPTRPEFYGTSVRKLYVLLLRIFNMFENKVPDPVTGDDEPYYPGTLRRTKMLLSLLVGMLMVFAVIASVTAVVIYKTWIRIRIKTSNSFVSFLLTTVGASFLNVVSIIILGKVYHIIAVKMTDWENYRTQTNYNDALILKLFAFHFANSYSSLFYIAFLRKNNQKFFQMIGLPDFEDNCGDLNNCVSELSVQVLILMICKLCPKFLTDILIPWMKKLKNKIKRNKGLSLPPQKQMTLSSVDDYIIKEYLKPDLGDFTLGEYTEKVIQYGYQMLFSISFPLAPLLFFITILFDIHVDAKRLLWMYKRPVAFMAQDIGHWLTVLDLINGVAIVTNACLIAFNTEYGRERPFYEQLIILIVIEHLVFVVRFLLSNMIPDVPQHIQLAMRREKYQVTTKMKGYPSSLHRFR